MTTTLRVHFDGKVLVPEGPVDLPVGQPLEIQVAPAGEKPQGFLANLAELAQKFPPDPESPGDAATQHDHYLYGTPKHP
jgi:hypothetical protein